MRPIVKWTIELESNEPKIHQFSLKKIHYSAFLLDSANELEDHSSKQPNDGNLPKAQLSDQQNSEAIEFLIETAHFMGNVDPEAVLLDITKYSCKLDAWSISSQGKLQTKFILKHDILNHSFQ